MVEERWYAYVQLGAPGRTSWCASATCFSVEARPQADFHLSLLYFGREKGKKEGFLSQPCRWTYPWQETWIAVLLSPQIETYQSWLWLVGWLFPLLWVQARLDGFHATFDAIHTSYLCTEEDKMHTVVGISYCFSFISWILLQYRREIKAPLPNVGCVDSSVTSGQLVAPNLLFLFNPF